MLMLRQCQIRFWVVSRGQPTFAKIFNKPSSMSFPMLLMWLHSGLRACSAGATTFQELPTLVFQIFDTPLSFLPRLNVVTRSVIIMIPQRTFRSLIVNNHRNYSSPQGYQTLKRYLFYKRHNAQSWSTQQNIPNSPSDYIRASPIFSAFRSLLCWGCCISHIRSMSTNGHLLRLSMILSLSVTRQVSGSTYQIVFGCCNN